MLILNSFNSKYFQATDLSIDSASKASYCNFANSQMEYMLQSNEGKHNTFHWIRQFSATDSKEQNAMIFFST